MTVLTTTLPICAATSVSLATGYYEQKRLHRLATAVANSRAAAEGASVDTLADLTPEEKEQLSSGAALGRGEVEIYAVKEVKLIGIAPHMFKLLQRTPTVRKMRRNLGISVSLVVLMGTDSSFEDVLSEDTKAKLVGEDGLPLPAVEYDSDDDEAEHPALHTTVDFPERYETLKHRAKLAVRSYTSMVHSRSPEQISNDIAIINEVIRVAANVRAVRRMDMELVQRFVYVFLDFPGLARIGKELAERGLFLHTKRIVHHLLAHSIVERYLDTIDAVMRHNPSSLLLKDADGKFLPCDRVKALPESKYFKYKMLSALLNLIPSINDERRRIAGDAAAARTRKALRRVSAGAEAGSAAAAGDEADADSAAEQAEEAARQQAAREVQLLRGDEPFMSLYSNDEELIVRAVHYGLPSSEAELKAKCFNVGKTDPATGESIFHKCAADWAKRPRGPALGTFAMALKAMHTRVTNATITQLEAEKMLFQKRTNGKANGMSLTVWELLSEVRAERMMDMVSLDWCRCGKSSGAPAAALTRKPSETAAFVPSATGSLPPQSSVTAAAPAGSSTKSKFRASPSMVLSATSTSLVEEAEEDPTAATDEHYNVDANGAVELNALGEASASASSTPNGSGRDHSYFAADEKEDDAAAAKAAAEAAAAKSYGTELDDDAVLEQKSSARGVDVNDVAIEIA